MWTNLFFVLSSAGIGFVKNIDQVLTFIGKDTHSLIKNMTSPQIINSVLLIPSSIW